jgi:anti-sigma factor RsiW
MMCNQTENIARYFDDELDASQRAAVEDHLQTCVPCQELLAEMRGLSQLIQKAPLPPLSQAAMGHYYGAWNKASRTSVLRMSSWLSGVAAAALVAGLLWPVRPAPPAASPKPVVWEAVALMPSMTPESGGERADDLVQMAQWMADDLADGSAGGR